MDSNSLQNFKTPTGKNYRESASLDLAPIKKYLQEEGFVVDSIVKQWRYYNCKLIKDHVSYFMKLSTTEANNELLQNEVSWSKALGPIVADSFFQVQEIVEVGLIGEYNYYISEWFDGKELAGFQYVNTTYSEDDLVTLAKIRVYLDGIDLPPEALYKDLISSEESKSVQKKAAKYIKISEDFASEVPKDLSPLLSIVSEWDKTLLLSLNHGGFEPRSLMKDYSGNYLLIDAEHATQFSPKYYDIAHCYVQLYCVAREPEMAELFLNTYFELSEFDQVDDQLYLRPAIASRLIGSYWDGVQEGREDFEFHDKLFETLRGSD